VVDKILEENTYAYRYDARASEYGNLISKGIIDPIKVVRVARRGAASFAGLLHHEEVFVACTRAPIIRYPDARQEPGPPTQRYNQSTAW
jgi:chaperonin GroEL (HSP60 family)